MIHEVKDWIRRFAGVAGHESSGRAVVSELMDPEKEFAASGSVPWSSTYYAAREQVLRRVLGDRSMLDRLRKNDPLPRTYGYHMDERCVEIPWLFSRLPEGGGRLLDAGSALNRATILDQPVMRQKKIHILTLAPESGCFWQSGIGYLYEDLRRIPVRDDLYDVVVSISTLEHVGMDNRFFTRSAEYREHAELGFLDAVKELHRVLCADGMLLLTVPFGVYEDHVSFQQFDSDLLDKLATAFPGRVLERSFFRYNGEGWQVASEAECRDCRYVSWVADVWAGRRELTPPLPVEPDGAAAARAVACMVLQK